MKWGFEADYLQACNCDYGCPCEFSAPPTMGFCEGVGVWKIREGFHGETKLDGLAIAFAARWPKAIHEGNGTLALFIDAKASPEQRDALLNICMGKAGGLPFEILAATISKALDPFFVPIEVQLNGRNSRAQLGNHLRLALEPIKNPVTGEPEDVRVDHGTGFVFKQAECTAGKECAVNVPGLSFSWPNKAGFVSTVNYRNDK